MHWHFRVTNAFTFLFVFLSILPMASPLSLASSPRDNVALNGLEERQASIIAGGEQSSLIHHSHQMRWHDSPVIITIINDVVQDIITDIINFQNNAHAVESNFTQQTIISLGNQYPEKNRLVFHDQDSTTNLCRFCLFCYRPWFLADFLKRPMPFMYTMKLTSATYSAFMKILTAMKFGSLTLALSSVLATVALLIGHSEGAIQEVPHRKLMSLSRRFNPAEAVDEGLKNGISTMRCNNKCIRNTAPYLSILPSFFKKISPAPQYFYRSGARGPLPSSQFGFFFCWFGISFIREGLDCSFIIK